MDTLVVGAGEMGRWFARQVGPPVAFADRDPAVAEAATRAFADRYDSDDRPTPLADRLDDDRHDGPKDRADDLTGDSPLARSVSIDGDEGFELVCIAVPMPAVEDAIEAHAGRARRAIVDVTGVMVPAVSAMTTHAPERERASLHPLFSSANAPGQVPIAVDDGGPVVEALRALLAEAGNDVFECTPEEHDEAMATIQGTAHAAVLAYGLAAESVPEEFSTPVSERLDDLVADVTDGDPRVYADIQAAFGGAGRIAAAAERINEADHEGFAELYREATAGRDGSSDGRNEGPDDGGVSR